MARPLKQGLDYFPLDINFLKDIKIRKIKRACGPATVEVLLCLLCNIYQDTGYYFDWDEDTIFLVADEVGIEESLVKEIVNKAVQVGFFNKEKFEKYNILTSRGIQSRYQEAAKKRKKIVISDIYLIKEEFPENKPSNNSNSESDNPINSHDNQQSKVKESKVNQSKENNSSDDSNFDQLIKFYEGNFGSISPLIYDDLKYSVLDYGFDLTLEAMKRAVRQSKTFKSALNILSYWDKNGIKTLEDAMAESAAFERKKSKSTNIKSQPRAGKKVPDWSDEAKLIRAGIDTTGMSQNEIYRLVREKGLANG
jgi:DnaD/phage-associated family protein